MAINHRETFMLSWTDFVCYPVFLYTRPDMHVVICKLTLSPYSNLAADDI